ncbi:MAG: hypothetical protein LQ350_007046 [Teloschistes chrysophthalmus]|nr:MAG: hypothetical protein LQ350_007046 [Niorma chrysophthalma]
MSSSVQLAINIWPRMALALDSGLTQIISLDADYSSALGKEGIDWIVERYKSMTEAPVQLFGSAGRPIRIMPVDFPNGSTYGIGNSKGGSQKVKIARPPNAFILYRQHHHSEVVSQNPSIHNNQISVILGKQWQNESAEVKANFKLMAEDIKKKHLHANPDYQYQPRKPSEKKRRMTRTKVGKMRAEEIAGTTAAFEETTYEETDIDVNLATTPFRETSTGNAVFTLGENHFDGVALAAAVENRNENLPASAAPRHSPFYPPVIFHSPGEDATDDANYYGNLLDLDGMYPTATEDATEEPSELPENYNVPRAPLPMNPVPVVLTSSNMDFSWMW